MTQAYELGDTIFRRHEGKSEKSLDVIFDKIDDLLVEGKFGECDAAVEAMPVNLLSNSQLLTLLTATAAASDKLPHRADFFSRTKEVLKLRGADAEGLLVGLE